MSVPTSRTGHPFTLPPQTHVGAVRLQVTDIGRTIAYYAEVVGLRVLQRAAETASLAPHGDDRPLLHLVGRPGSVPALRGANGLFHFAILLPERAALGRFVSHLRSSRVPFGASDHLVSEATYLTDPDGLGIEVYADRPRDAWLRVNGGLAMATDPLDLRSVMAAGAGAPWTGAPAGTTMGHMHLHVGDLDEARRFYHDALGLDVTSSTYPGALFLSAGGYHHHLGTNVWGSGATPSDQHARLLDWELIVPGGAHNAVHRLLEAGYRVETQANACAAWDPWGTRIEFRE